MQINVCEYCISDVRGGASRASYRIHKSLLDQNIKSKLYVERKFSADKSVISSHGSFSYFLSKARAAFGKLPVFLHRTKNPILHSPSILPSFLPHKINRSSADIIHLHWVCAEMMSIEDIGRIKKPIVWTFHDMWPFCGAEHYTEDMRWREGYFRHNRPEGELGFDLNRWTWRRKKRNWNDPMTVVAPSRWMAKCVTQSALMNDWPVFVVPNPIDTHFWEPVKNETARAHMGLPADCRLLGFSDLGGADSRRKGMDLLIAALKQVPLRKYKLELVVFGKDRQNTFADLGLPVHFVGTIHDDVQLKFLYSAVDAIVIPSRQDNLPNVGVESLSCGTPVVAFDVCGLPDIVVHKKTGWLASPFDVKDLAEGIHWIMQDNQRIFFIREKAREYSLKNFSFSAVASKYIEVYSKILN